jgi:hypothetical protein
MLFYGTDIREDDDADEYVRYTLKSSFGKRY